jgi:hypothetical protein
VTVQGVLGGLRVVLLDARLAIVHGALAQAFFALVAALALLTSARMRAAAGREVTAAAPLATVAALAVYAQIVLGALLTHEGRLVPHLTLAGVVFVLVPITASRLSRTGDPVATPVARLLLVLLALQLVLGAGAYLARFSPIWIPGGQATTLALPVAHRLVASLILGAATMLAVRAAGGRTAPGSAAASDAVAEGAVS